MYIYVDILIITNIYADFFLLKATARLTHSPLKNGRCVLAAMAGSLFSLVILLPQLSAVSLLAIKIFSAVLMVYIAFRGRPIRELYRTALIFFFVCFIFAGAEYAVAALTDSGNVVWHNSVLYVNISLLTLVISTAGAYAALCLFRRFLDRGNAADGCFTLIIVTDKGRFSVRAVADTCNNLTDFFSGKPVIVCGRRQLEDAFEKELLDTLLCCTVGASDSPPRAVSGWRYIPCRTVSSDGLLPVFMPTGTYLRNDESAHIKAVDVYIGITERELDYAVFNPKIL